MYECVCASGLPRNDMRPGPRCHLRRFYIFITVAATVARTAAPVDIIYVYCKYYRYTQYEALWIPEVEVKGEWVCVSVKDAFSNVRSIDCWAFLVL